jgi:hypothetical protein
MGLVDDLAKLAELHSTGALSDMEYAAAKTRLIEGMPSAAEVRPVVEKSVPVETAKDPDAPPKPESLYVWDGVQRGVETAKDPDAPLKRTPTEEKRPDKRKNADEIDDPGWFPVPTEEKRPDKRKNEDDNHQQGCCPSCRSAVVPTTKRRVSTQGWIVSLVVAFCCFPLSILALLINIEEYRVCPKCGYATPPTPKWAGVVFTLVGLALVGLGVLAIVSRDASGNADGLGIYVMASEVFIGLLGVLAIMRGIQSLSAPSKV